MIVHQLRRHLSTQRRLVTWHQLSTTFDAVVASPSRISKTALLSSCFRDVMATDIHNFSPSLQLTLGSQKLGIGAAALRSSAAQFLNLDLEQVEEREQAVGDLAEAVTSLWQQNHQHQHQHQHQQHDHDHDHDHDHLDLDHDHDQTSDSTLHIHDVTNLMSVAATIHGADSNATREKLITDLLRRCGTASEVKYLLRTLSGGLRIGMGETSIVGAAARAALCDDEIMDVAAVKRAEALGRSMYSSRCDPSQFATKLAGTYDFRLQHGQAAAFTMCEAQAHPAPLIPARAMLASPAKSVDEAVQFFVKNSENGRRDIVCQSKYDGERAQIHVVVVKDEESSSSSSSSSMRAAGEDRTTYTRVYSRVGEDNSLRYQQIAERVGELLLQHHSDGGGEPLVSCILDGEVAAVDRETNRLLPFQTLTRRTRDGRDNKVAAKQSHDDDGDDIDDDDIDDDIDQPAATLKSSSSSSSSVPLPPCDVCFYAFDLLEYNGRSLVDQPLRERRKIMQQIIHPMVGELEVGEELQIQVGEGLLEAPATIHAALEAAVKSGCEGLVVKALDGKGTEYKCGERTRNWLKLKKDYVDSVDGALDTFDLVVLGAYYGKGKRQGLYGSFLMGCLNEEQEGGYRTVCKVGTGFTDQMLKDIHFELSQLQVPHHRRSGDDQDEERKKSNDCSNAYDVRTNIRPMPDVWFEPKKVWEVRAADISLSKAHSSCHDQLKRLGHVNDGQSSGGRGGLALRFPRFVRFREDKNIHDATKESQMLDMYLDQTTQPQEKK